MISPVPVVGEVLARAEGCVARINGPQGRRFRSPVTGHSRIGRCISIVGETPHPPHPLYIAASLRIAIWESSHPSISAMSAAAQTLNNPGSVAPHMQELRLTSVEEVEAHEVDAEGAVAVRIQWLIGKEEAPTFATRRFTLGAGGHTPFHSHGWEHEVFVLQGRGALLFGEERDERPLAPGNFVYVPACAVHQFRNDGEEDFVFLCIIPVRETAC